VASSEALRLRRLQRRLLWCIPRCIPRCILRHIPRRIAFVPRRPILACRYKKARFIPTARSPAWPHASDEEFPLVLNTGRIRDQWHTHDAPPAALLVSRSTCPRPFVDLHAHDALLGGELARDELATCARTRWGSIVCSCQGPAVEIARAAPRSPPIHWNSTNASDGACRRSRQSRSRSCIRRGPNSNIRPVRG